ncbi:MAG: hypothetical protein RR932_04625 [Acinetobacter sp.]
MKIIPTIGLKAARKAIQDSGKSTQLYSPSAKRAFKKRSTRPDDAIPVSDIITEVDYYETVLFYGSPGHAKQHLENAVLEPGEEAKIKEALAYFRDVAGLDL